MIETTLKYHFLLMNQLKRSRINEEDIASSKRDAWNDFLVRINRTYFDNDQERYLLERSMEISSREMMDLNEKLEYAQKIAHLGSWFYNKKENKVHWSKETFNLTGFDPAEGEPKFEELIELIHENDREMLLKSFHESFENGKEFEMEFQFKNKKDNKYYWHYSKGYPVLENDPNQGVQYLSGITIDITDRKESEENVKRIHQQLLSISRQAGMAEVASSVLHNIGNILNSANVSISLLLELLSQSNVNKLKKLSDLLHKPDYLNKEENRKLLSDYLEALSKTLLNEQGEITSEINNINVHLIHIKEIVDMQKDLSGIVGIKENIILTDVVDLAIQMSSSLLESKEKEIVIEKNYLYKKSISIEKAKLLQILVNLIRNAKDATMASQNTPHKIMIDILEMNEKNGVEIRIKDNGIGIANENLTRIFSLGFTTKPNGHGFGLHGSAIAAKEMGGELEARSAGIGQGAEFIIQLPILPRKKLIAS